MKALLRKSYSRKLSANYSSEEFITAVEKEIEYSSKEEYLAESEKLAAQVKSLTIRDIEKHSELLKGMKTSDVVMVEDKA